ncbi:MAG: hypothetical protein R3D32_07205 [Nitratireductor sp.]
MKTVTGVAADRPTIADFSLCGGYLFWPEQIGADDDYPNSVSVA